MPPLPGYGGVGRDPDRCGIFNVKRSDGRLKGRGSEVKPVSFGRKATGSAGNVGAGLKPAPTGSKIRLRPHLFRVIFILGPMGRVILDIVTGTI
jgi:hypothetical protein